MIAALEHDLLKQLSASLSGLVAAAAPSVVTVHSHRSQSSGFVLKSGLIVTADEALAEEGEVAVTLASGKRVSAAVAGRDSTTDVALLRAETGDTPVVNLDGTPSAAGALAVVVGGLDGHRIVAMAS